MLRIQTTTGNKIAVFHHRKPQMTPWYLASVDYVIEASGIFTSVKAASMHFESIPGSVKRVLVMAPSLDAPTIILGVNHKELTEEMKTVSCASTTLYCLAPIVKVLDDNFGVVEGMMTNLHSLTPLLKTIDGYCTKGKFWRDHRSALQNVIPAASSACHALGRVLPHLDHKLLGVVYRVPVPDVCLLDLTIRLEKPASLSDIKICIDEASRSHMKNIITTCDEESVSSDFKGNKHSCVVDMNTSIQLNKYFYKIVCWYDNELSYACRVAELILYAEKLITLRTPFKTNATCNNTLPNTRLNHNTNTSDINHIKNKNQSALSICTRKDIVKDEIKERTPTMKSNTRFEKQFTVPVIKSKEIANQNVNALKYRDSKTLQNTTFLKDFITCLDIEKASKLASSILWQAINNHVDKKHQATSTHTPTIFTSFPSKHGNSNACCSGREKRHQNLAIRPQFSNANKIVMKKPNTNNRVSSALPNVQKIENDLSRKIDVDHVYEISDEIKSDIHLILQCTETVDSEDNGYNKIAKNNDLIEEIYSVLQMDKSVRCEEEEYVYFVGEPKRSSSNMTHNKKSITEISQRYYDSCMKLNLGNHIIEPLTQDFGAKRDTKSYYLGNTNIDANKKHISPEPKNPSTSFASKNKRKSMELCDKLESTSDTDSEGDSDSFKLFDKKSLEIEMCDVTDSVEDLERLDQICRIIEISDDLTDSLFLRLENKQNNSCSTQEWSVKAFCEKVDLDDFLKCLATNK